MIQRIWALNSNTRRKHNSSMGIGTPTTAWCIRA